VNRLAISTSWNAQSAPDAASMISEINKMGFDRIELNFTLTNRDICDIISVRGRRRHIEITSLHNFCPIPDDMPRQKASPDYYSLSSLDEGERKKALDATRTTIETAKTLGASAVILHLGKIKIKDKTRKLAAAVYDKANYERIKNGMLKERGDAAPKYLDRTFASVETLLGYAKENGVRLGIENRYYYSEIPSPEEIAALLRHFADKNVGYWHDVGHAQIFENIGLFNHKRDFLDRLSGNIIGMHLHDITGADDHRAPLQGSFDFAVLKPYIKKDTLLVLEPHQPSTPEQIKRGAGYLNKLFGLKG